MNNTDMKEYWNGAGGDKWVRFQETMDVHLLPFRQKAMAAANFSPGEKALDVGCGCGDTSLEIARRVGSDGRVRGVDISEPILAHAKARASSMAAKTVEFTLGDAQSFPLENAAFDVVFSRFGVMFFDDPTAAFGNLRQALRPDGRMAFICWQPLKDNEWINTPLQVVLNHVPTPSPPEPDAPGPLSFGDPERVKRILADAGFSDVTVTGNYTPFAVGADIEEAVEFLMQMGPASGAITQAEADEATKSRIADDLRKALVPYDTGAGVAMNSASWIVTATNSEVQ